MDVARANPPAPMSELAKMQKWVDDLEARSRRNRAIEAKFRAFKMCHGFNVRRELRNRLSGKTTKSATSQTTLKR